MADTVAPRAAVPMLSYEDVGAAADWLCEAFGFHEVGERYTDDEGHVSHVEIQRDGAAVFLGWPGPDYRNPVHHAATCEDARRWLDVPFVVDGVHITVDDVDAHCEWARAAGATIIREPDSRGPRRLYSAADPEGHRWMFMAPPV